MQEEDGVASVSPIIQTEVVPWDTYVFLDSLSVTGTVIYSRVQKCPPLRLSIRVSNNIAPIRPHVDIYNILVLSLAKYLLQRGNDYAISRKELHLHKFRFDTMQFQTIFLILILEKVA